MTASPALHTLMDVLLPFPDAPEGLYLHLRDRGGEEIPLASLMEDGALRLPAGTRLTLDTWFNSFYLAYWRRFTDVGEVMAEFDFDGELFVDIHEFTQMSGTQCRGSARVHGGERSEPVLIDAGAAAGPFPAHGTGRLFLEIRAETDSVLRAARFVTPTRPKREPTLSVGLCTFSREKELAATLGQLLAVADGNPFVRDVWVVNQAAPFTDAGVLEAAADPRVTVIEQGNLGGCGGFTRTMVEAMETAEPASHHLLMDDDIILDGRVIERCRLFLAHANRDLVIGGAMLDSFAPHRMHEAGAYVNRNATIKPHCSNVDMTVSTAAVAGRTFPPPPPGGPAATIGVNQFAGVPHTDFNAWWFCVIPLERAREVGLPAPIFIRGDDIEFGQRLARAGVPTVTLPGVAVWHEPFYIKAAGWQHYYDLRNRLIFSATYPGRAAPPDPVDLFEVLLTPVLVHNYQTAELRLRGVEDFLGGPDRLFARRPEELHAEVAALAKAHAPETLDAPPPGLGTIEIGRTKPKSVFQHVVEYVPRVIALGFLPLSKAPKRVLVDHTIHPSQVGNAGYVRTNIPRTYFLRYEPDRKRARSLFWRSVKAWWRFRREVGRVSAEWNGGIDRYRTRETWTPLFSAGPEAQAAAPAPSGKAA